MAPVDSIHAFVYWITFSPPPNGRVINGIKVDVTVQAVFFGRHMVLFANFLFEFVSSKAQFEV